MTVFHQRNIGCACASLECKRKLLINIRRVILYDFHLNIRLDLFELIQNSTLGERFKVTLWMWKAAHEEINKSGVWDEFKKVQPNVEVEVVEYNPSDVYQKLPLALQAGTGA